MAASHERIVDPRIRRTRLLLQQSLAKLLETNEFETLSVQDITDAATLNRATFYDHYPDKFALLECMVASRFHQLLAHRGIKFDGGCSSALRAIVLGVCDYLWEAGGKNCPSQREKDRHLESAIIAVLREMILDGLRQRPSKNAVSPEMIAATVSSAIYGGAKEWLRGANRCPSEVIADTLVMLVDPILQVA